MKPPLDENLIYRLVAQLAPAFPDSQHVDLVGLHAQADSAIWKFAGDHGFTIVSKDIDFRQLSFLHGAPPLLTGGHGGPPHCEIILGVLNNGRLLIEEFVRNPEQSLLILELPADRF